MSTIAQNLQTIATAKANIATSVNAKGGNITSETPLSAYSAAIDAIPSGGGGGEPDWSEIGYSGAPQSVLDAFDYSKDIYDNWDTGETSMNSMFAQDHELVYFPLVDTSNVTQMQYTFNYCSKLTNFPLCDTSKVTSFHGTFDKSGVKTIPLICTSACTDMSEMFVESPIESVPLLDTRNVTNMNMMFSSCQSLTGVPAFNTSACTDMGSMFDNCSSLTTVPLLDTSNVENMASMFAGCSSLSGIPAFNTSACTTMSSMFYYCENLTDIPALNTSACTSMNNMFHGCSSLSGFSALSGYDFTNVQDCGDMFSETNLQITTFPVINTVNCTNFGSMLRFNSSALTRVEGIYLNSWQGGQIFGDWPWDPDAQENHPNLTYVMLYNLGMSENAYDDFDLSCLMDWGDGGSANHQSLIDSLYTNAFDRATAGYETRKIKLHPYTYARLSQQEIDNIESKGYEVVDISNE